MCNMSCMCHLVRRHSSAINFDRVEIAFISALFVFVFVWTINRWRWGGNRSTRRKSLATSFRKCHILAGVRTRELQRNDTVVGVFLLVHRLGSMHCVSHWRICPDNLAGRHCVSLTDLPRQLGGPSLCLIDGSAQTTWRAVTVSHWRICPDSLAGRHCVSLTDLPRQLGGPSLSDGSGTSLVGPHVV